VPGVRGLIATSLSFVVWPTTFFRSLTVWLVDSILGPLRAWKKAVKKDTSAESEWKAISERCHWASAGEIPFVEGLVVQLAGGGV